MIVVVEGISAAGKTRWCLANAGEHLVPESSPHGSAPDRAADPEGAARFWVERNEARWASAVALDRRSGLAVCDTDPLKLHYAWCLWRVAALAERHWRLERDLTRSAIAAGRLGFADLYLVKRISAGEARRRRDSDPLRSRRNFDLHVRLAEPLAAWYSALEAVLPGRVMWALPETAIPTVEPRRRDDDLPLFDALVRALPE